MTKQDELIKQAIDKGEISREKAVASITSTMLLDMRNKLRKNEEVSVGTLSSEMLTDKPLLEQMLRLNITEEDIIKIAKYCSNQKAQDEARKSLAPKVGRNQPCPCGSGKKYKRCCGR